MCEALKELMKEEIDEAVNTAVNAAVNAAVDETATATKLDSIKNVMDSLKVSAEQAMDILKIPKSKRVIFLAKL